MIEVVRGDITAQHVDAIVNAANTALAGGGGVDGAIHRAGGPAILEACRALPLVDGKRCPVGEARATVAGRLPAKWVVHTVGPFYDARHAERCADQLRRAHLSSLREAERLGCRTIAFPAISCGAYRYPVADAARVAVAAVREHLAGPHGIELVRFVCFGEREREAFEAALAAQTA